MAESNVTRSDLARCGADLRVGIGYALVYPAAMIAKILLAQILAGLS